jgi:CRISPR-associated protein Cmr6
MTIAAVPDYLGKDFGTASPGMRFGYYLSIWNSDWNREIADPKDTWKSITCLNKGDKRHLESIESRQRRLATSFGDAMFSVDAVAISPFSTGLGNEHPLENGFAFLSPYGLPYLPGSGVKGVVRQSALELASGDWEDTGGWSEDRITALFGPKGADGDSEHQRGALSFWDVIPLIKDDALQVEIMTPHQGHYYQQKKDRKTGGSISPHDSGQPNPISFLTVPPGSRFAFHVLCDLELLGHIGPELIEGGRWKQLLVAAFEHAFAWCGFGAKTAVGYGAMGEDQQKKAERERQEAARQEELRLQREKEAWEREIEQMDPIDREIARFLDARRDKNQPEINALIGGLTSNAWGDEQVPDIAAKIKSMMQAEKQWKEKSEKKNPDKDRDYQRTKTVMGYLKKPEA